MARMEQGVSTTLATDAAQGRQMRRVARGLFNWEIEGTLRLRPRRQPFAKRNFFE